MTTSRRGFLRAIGVATAWASPYREKRAGFRNRSRAASKWVSWQPEAHALKCHLSGDRWLFLAACVAKRLHLSRRRWQQLARAACASTSSCLGSLVLLRLGHGGTT